MKTTLQKILYPSLAFNTDHNAYFRTAGAYFILSEKRINFHQKDEIHFNTYYNSISLTMWKQTCDIKNLNLNLKGLGKFFLRISVAKKNNYFDAHSPIDTINYENIEIQLNQNETYQYTLNFFEQLPDTGILYFSLVCISETGFLEEGEWYTTTKSKNFVKLGIVITHFNRKDYVLNAIDRIKTQLFDEYYKDKIDLVIIDNSQNLTKEESKGITVIPNENLGGSGGFMRGLLHYKDNGNFTHVQFMDDDASFEIDALKRAYSILAYAKNPKTAVSGALLREDIPYLLIEQGAKFKNGCIPFFANSDIRNENIIVHTEHPLFKPNYGAWWFFAFPISYIQNFSFPFFVRGDDVNFSLSNDFNIVNNNGIACYGENFATKESPVTLYLDIRNNLINQTIQKKPSLSKLYKSYKSFYKIHLDLKYYDSIETIRLGLKDVLKGENFWIENVDMQSKRKELAKIIKYEKPETIDLTSIDYDIVNPYFSSRKKRLKYKFSICGLLTPLKNKILLKEKNTVYPPKENIYKYKYILTYNSLNKKGFIVPNSKLKNIKYYILMYQDLFKIIFKYRWLKKEYPKIMKNIATEKFWRKNLKI